MMYEKKNEKITTIIDEKQLGEMILDLQKSKIKTSDQRINLH